MRLAVEECRDLDEVADLRDKAAALAAYARQRDDKDLDVWMSEIRLRACMRIGELSRELEKAEAHGGTIRLPSGGKSKEQTLAEAGLSTSAAARYEALSAYNEETRPIFVAATEKYLAERARNGAPATYSGIKEAIRSALVGSGVKLPEKKGRAERALPDYRFVDFSGRLHELAERQNNFDPEFLASQVIPDLVEWELEAAQIASERICAFMAAVRKRFGYAQ
jgi:hypothetical protein